ncbi:MAG TPA: 30S ribosomal protein S18 [Acidimicrobiia bacterium]|jgi:small subunit ribosomal protein S18|nr:30S ribosomal protein S18 [Acidimicrobiia bacterium]
MARKNRREPRVTTRGRRHDFRRGKQKGCAICPARTVDWKDTALLRKYVSDRGKIRGRRVTGLCPHCQRRVATAVKNAREMALLPYVGGR